MQVAINWTLCKGALPIPGAKNARQVKEAAGALGWRMSPDQVSCLLAMCLCSVYKKLVGSAHYRLSIAMSVHAISKSALAGHKTRE